jgi:hypothetical protein
MKRPLANKAGQNGKLKSMQLQSGRSRTRGVTDISTALQKLRHNNRQDQKTNRSRTTLLTHAFKQYLDYTG